MKSSSRNGARVRLLAVHTTEGIMRARDLIAFFNRSTAQGSSHAGADNTGALLGPEAGYVPYDRAAWTLRSGNPVSDNLEYCGWARYTRQQWLTAESDGLEAIARWLADRSRARGIPLVKLTPAEVRAGRSGVIGHVDWTEGMNDGTHWDPGPGFPWDVVIARAQQIANGDDDMPLSEQDLDRIRDRVWTASYNNKGQLGAGPGFPHIKDRVIGVDLGVGAVAGGVSKLLADGGDDAKALVEALRPLLMEAATAAAAQVREAAADEDADEIAAKVVAGIADRMTA